MKQFFRSLFNKASVLLQEDVATRDRSVIFRVATLILVTGNIFYIIFYFIRSVG